MKNRIIWDMLWIRVIFWATTAFEFWLAFFACQHHEWLAMLCAGGGGVIQSGLLLSGMPPVFKDKPPDTP